jgi:serine/threonine-protein kinase
MIPPSSQVDPSYQAVSEALRTAFSGIRYSPLRYHNQGGLGVIFVARDQELGREVALKRIRADHFIAPSDLERFRREGEITGCLEHPGIVPVYGLGTDADGQPYYTMRFIRGSTLKNAIEEFHGRPPMYDPAKRSLAFRSLLSQLIAACNVVAYAHSRGVVHRDLKPANIMIGQYGETLVVDWGLAKVIGSSAFDRDPAEAALSPSPEASVESTEIGHIMGTPTYMSPEQANGDWSEVGPASDIFSLGGILYTLLAGQPPYQGKYAATVLEKAKKCELVPPATVRPAAPPALDAVCMKAMSRNPVERYATAQDLASELECWLADESVRAFREPWSDRVRRWVRRRRSTVTLLLGIIATGVLGMAITTVLLGRAQRQTVAALEQSRGLLDGMLARIGEDEAWLRQSPRVNRLRLRLLRESLSGYRDLLAQRSDDSTIRRSMALTLRRTGDVAAELALFDEASADYAEAESIFRALQAAAGRDERSTRDLAECLHSQGNLASDNNRLAEAETRHRAALELREGVATTNPKRLELHRDVTRSLINLGNVTRRLGSTRARDTERTYRSSVETARTLVSDSEGAASERRLLALALNNRGVFLRDNDRLAEARSDFDEALHLRRALLGEFPENPDYGNDVAGTLGNLALVDLRDGDPLTAQKRLTEAQPLNDAALKANPDHPTYRLFHRNNLAWAGHVHAQMGDHSVASQDAERIASLGFTPASDAAEAAAILVRCAGAAHQDAALSEGDRLDRNRHYLERAHQLAKQAKRLGFDAKSAKSNFLLTVLREFPETHSLIENEQ